jgi:hypothetical protein
MENNQLTQMLNMFMQAAASAFTPEETTAPESAELELEVEDSTATAVATIEVILQGTRKQPSRDTLVSYVSNSQNFGQLRTELFQQSTARGTGVSVVADGVTTVYSETDRIPGSLLDATNLRITYSVDSGRNG